MKHIVQRANTGPHRVGFAPRFGHAHWSGCAAYCGKAGQVAYPC
jgi:hypothetical protein